MLKALVLITIGGFSLLGAGYAALTLIALIEGAEELRTSDD